MVLGTQSTVNEDSQSRQLRVSKKLSKAISSVPRSRFQKPRPNLPGAKRSEPNAPSTRKANETTENFVTTKTENSNVKELSSKCDAIESPATVTTLDTSSNNEIGNAPENLTINEVSQEVDTVKSTDDILIIEKSQTADELKKSLNTDEASESHPAEVSKNCISETSHSDATENSISTNEYIQELSGEKAFALEAPDNSDVPSVNTPNNNTDKSFKYPHLTSILSKKRTEPKKEVQHKKRKKFKKGDAAPERSKMTMADLIYWNPTNTEPPAKSADVEIEIPVNSNVDDPEESPDIDNPVEENNICDSVPKLVISEDGSINIDQSSLVVSRNIAEPTITEVIRKDDTTYSSFRKRPMTKHWTAKDTTIFYKALSLVGTDFGLMEKIFPHRTRRELKLKFKREEKFNIDLINRAMYESHLTFDANTLGDLIKNLNDLTGDFCSENGQEDSQSAAKEKKKPVKRKRKTTKITEPVDSGSSDTLPEPTGNEVTVNNNKTKSKRRRKTKKLPDDFINIDEIEEILLNEEETGETNSNVEISCEIISTEVQQVTSDGNLVKKDTGQNLDEKEHPESQSSIPSSNDICDATNIDDVMGVDFNTENLEKEHPELQSSIPSSNDICNVKDIEILNIDDVIGVDFTAKSDAAILVVENASDKSDVMMKDSGHDKTPEIIPPVTGKEESCISVEYVDVNESGDLTLLGNVMAFEVVAHNTPIPKRRRKTNFTPKLPKREMIKVGQPIKLSSTNYTPV